MVHPCADTSGHEMASKPNKAKADTAAAAAARAAAVTGGGGDAPIGEDQLAVAMLASQMDPTSDFLKRMRLDYDPSAYSLLSPTQSLLDSLDLSGAKATADFLARNPSDYLYTPPPSLIETPSYLGSSGPKLSEIFSHRADEAALLREEVQTALKNLEAQNDQHANALKQLTAKLDKDEQRLREASESERQRERDAEAIFWYRRAILSLQIGHGAVLAAVLGGLMQAENIPLAARVASGPAAWFGAGLVAAGVLPFLLWAAATTWGERFRRGVRAALAVLTAVSAACFLAGVGHAWVAIERVGASPDKVAAAPAPTEGALAKGKNPAQPKP